MKTGHREFQKNIGSARVLYRVHAVKQMFDRKISEREVTGIVSYGKVIEEYQNDSPYPSYLLFGAGNERPLHVVMAYNNEDNEVIVITAYEPDASKWESDFMRRKK
jgi:hypothetical protein